MASLTVIETTEALHHIALAGRLDLSGANQLEPEINRQITVTRRPILVDLAKVEFIASLGIGLLVANARGLARHGFRMVLWRPPELVDKALRAAGVERIIPITADRDEAMRLLRGE